MDKLLVVDDDTALRRWAERVLDSSGYACEGAGDAAAARAALAGGDFALALVDINMPGESGIELLGHIRATHPSTAVLMVTAQDDSRVAMTAIEQGAYGYMVKPVRAGEMQINVANALHRRREAEQNRRLLRTFAQQASDHSARLEAALQELRLSRSEVWVSQAETIFRLARLVEFRDEETGHHIQRMSSFCEILADRLGFGEEHRERLRLASQLHDVGKVAIPDTILQKPGSLDESERAVIETHAEIGYEMLAGSPSEIVQLGALIARSHHERWDGSGYPHGLAGEAIPAEGRVAAIADVFDALTTDRVYRPAFPLGLAVETMQAERGTHFDPHMLDEFVAALPEVEAVRRAYLD